MSIIGVLGRGWGSPTDESEIEPRNNGKDRPDQAKDASRLELPQELSRVHHIFHVSNLKKCYADEPLVMPLEGIHVDDKLQFVEEPGNT
ncbi:hypothetical protein Tco_0889824 [Tanacetum coccineum]